MEVNSGDNSLTIRNVQSTDSGRYICSAYSQYGTAQDEVELTVLGIYIYITSNS